MKTRPALPKRTQMNGRRFRHVIAACLTMLSCALPGAAMAWCAYPTPDLVLGKPNMGTKILNIGTVLVPQGAAIGAVVKDYQLDAGSGLAWYCSPSGGSLTYVSKILWGTPVLGSDRIYSTNVPGIGYRLSLSNPAFASPTFPGSRVLNVGVATNPNQHGRFASETWRIRLELIKTADRVGNGPLLSVPVGRVTLTGAPSSQPPDQQFLLVQLGDIRILAPSCQVAVGSRNQTVNLGQEFRNRFRGVGTTTASQDFQVAVNCQASPNGIENTVSLTMDAKADASNAPGVLGIDTGSGMARGVGIQVLDGTGQTVQFGQAKELGPSKDGDYVLPFKARYYQVAGAVSNGKANGRATVTLSYK